VRVGFRVGKEVRVGRRLVGVQEDDGTSVGVGGKGVVEQAAPATRRVIAQSRPAQRRMFFGAVMLCPLWCPSSTICAGNVAGATT
jgi:hypothetical protein